MKFGQLLNSFILKSKQNNRPSHSHLTLKDKRTAVHFLFLCLIFSELSLLYRCVGCEREFTVLQEIKYPENKVTSRLLFQL